MSFAHKKTILYTREVRNITLFDYYHMTVLWNNTFLETFNCCWAESTMNSLARHTFTDHRH